MPRYSTTRVVAHTPKNMFDLVADVERYPEFVPLCRSLTLRSRQPMEGGREILVADMTVAYKMIRETFTSRVTLDRTNFTILTHYIQGPFRHLENRWHFRALGSAQTEVVFTIAYDFKNRALAALMGAMFDRAFRKFASAFEARADAIYGCAA